MFIFFSFFIFKISEINSDIGFDTRLNNGVPEWSARGADTWSPFSKKYTIVNIDSSYDVKILYPNLYNKLTLDNFIFQPNNIGGHRIRYDGLYGAEIRTTIDFYQNFSYTYNSTTGIFAVSAIESYTAQGTDSTKKMEMYIVKGFLENLLL